MTNFQKDMKKLNFLIKNDNLDKVTEYIEELIIKYPRSGIVSMRRAEIKYKQGEVEEAKELYLDVINNDTGIAQIFCMRDLFIIYIKQNLIQEAKELFEKIENSQMEKSLYLFLKSMLLRNSNQYLESCKLIMESIEIANDKNDTYLLNSCLDEIMKNHTDNLKRKNYLLIKEVIQKVYSTVNGKSKARMTLYLAQLEQLVGHLQDSLNLYRTAANYNQRWIRGNAIVGICKIYLMINEPGLLNSVEFEELKTYDFQDAYCLVAQIYSSYNNFEQAIQTIESYPQNLRMLFEKAKIFAKHEKYEEAIDLFMQCFEIGDDHDAIKIFSLLNVIKINIHFEYYEEAYKILKENKQLLEEISRTEYYQTEAYLCSKLGYEYKSYYYSYSILQLLNYNNNETYFHLGKHIEDFNEIINFDGDISKFLCELQSKLTIKYYDDSTMLDAYIVKYPGKNGDIYIEVLTIPNTNKIITCYVSNKRELMYEDIDEIVSEPCKQKVIKRKTQIEKFNEKYGIKGE